VIDFRIHQFLSETVFPLLLGQKKDFLEESETTKSDSNPDENEEKLLERLSPEGSALMRTCEGGQEGPLEVRRALWPQA
jgi:hypothetical protein